MPSFSSLLPSTSLLLLDIPKSSTIYIIPFSLDLHSISLHFTSHYAPHSHFCVSSDWLIVTSTLTFTVHSFYIYPFIPFVPVCCYPLCVSYLLVLTAHSIRVSLHSDFTCRALGCLLLSSFELSFVSLSCRRLLSLSVHNSRVIGSHPLDFAAFRYSSFLFVSLSI